MSPAKDITRLVEMAPDAIPLPATTMKIIRLMNDASSTAGQVADVMETDQALTARVLRVANSAYYGLPRRVATARDAVVLLGHNTLRSLIFTASVSGILGRKATGYALGEGELWKHSMGVANGCRLIARRNHRGLAEEAYVAGLLHDIGKIVLEQFLREEFANTMEVANAKSLTFDQAEREIFGLDHAQVGGLLAERWQLPPDFVSAIRHHHSPLEAKDALVITAIVHIADLIALELGLGLGADGLRYPLVAETFAITGITPEQHAEIAAEVGATAHEAESLLN